MSKGYFRLMAGTVWLVGCIGVHAQDTLYTNGTSPSFNAPCQYFTSACMTGGAILQAQQFSLQASSIVSSMTVVLTDNNANPADSIYNWEIYAIGSNGLPTGAQPLDSGTASVDGSDGSQYTYTSTVGGSEGDLQYLNFMTVSTGPIDLATGSYYFALSGSDVLPPEDGYANSFEGWVQSDTNTGLAVSNNGVWSAGADSFGAGGLSLTVTGRQAPSAPELSPSTSIAALTLLFGTLMVYRGRQAARVAGHS